jgi:hydrogenase/urease accessory protein HupE
MRWSRRLSAIAIACIALTCQAHEVRPAFLQLKETAPSIFEVVWKQPILGDRRLPIDPVLPAGCKSSPASPTQTSNGALLQSWSTQCDLRTGSIAIRGLERTLTDVMVRVEYLNGARIDALLRGAEPQLDLADPTPSTWSYLRLGVEHLLFGIDHILFVIGLVLFIANGWSLLKTVTAFTLAHSITLALSVLGVITLPQAPVEAVIALSILFLARELVLPEQRRSAITRTRPWVMAFAFGLLHGFGFAGALADIGLPTDQLAPALLLFNVGIEVGQLAVIGGILLASAFLRALHPASASWAGFEPKGLRNMSFGGAMGIAAAFWTIDRAALIF